MDHLLGSPILLKFGEHITLPEELAPGVAGSFLVSVQVNFKLPEGALLPSAYALGAGDSGGAAYRNIRNVELVIIS